MLKSDKNPKTSGSILPLIFSIGFIGWGFFALDRLLPQKYENFNIDVVDKYQNIYENLEKKKDNNESWKKSLKSWLSNLLEEDNQDLQTTPKDNISFEKEDINDDILISYKELLIYNYTIDQDDFPVLMSKPFFSDDLSSSQPSHQMKTIFLKTIKANKKNHDNAISIFSPSVQLLSTYIEDSSIVLNFNDEFGKGVSLQLFKYQIELLLKTAFQFSNINSIQLKIDDQELDYLEGDGISLPKKINAESVF